MIFSTRNVTLNEGKSLFLVPFGDMQSEKELDRLEGLVQWLLNRQSEGHQIGMFGMGDYFEAPSPSDRAALRAAKSGFGMYDDLAKTIMDAYEGRTLTLARYLEPIVPDIYGLLRGHHWLEFIQQFRPHLPRDTNVLLAELLKAEYWGSTIQLELSINDLPFKIFAAHGYGSARTPGARVTKRIRMREVVLDAHWYVQGHDNEKVVYPTEALVGRKYIKQYFSGSGSLQRSYSFDEAEGSYAEDLLLPPSVLGFVIARISIQTDKNGQKRLDYHVST